jgi:hypothetical protein
MRLVYSSSFGWVGADFWAQAAAVRVAKRAAVTKPRARAGRTKKFRGMDRRYIQCGGAGQRISVGGVEIVVGWI